MYERFTPSARKVMLLAQEESRVFGHDHISPDHIFLGLLREEEGVGARALAYFNGTYKDARNQFESLHGFGKRSGTRVLFTQDAKKVLELALREALQLGHNYVGTEHLLLAFLRLDTDEIGFAKSFLLWLGVGDDELRRQVLKMLDSPSVEKPRGAATVSTINKETRAMLTSSRGTVPLNTGAVRARDLLRVGPLHIDLRKTRDASFLVATLGKRFASVQWKINMRVQLKTGKLRSERHRSLLRMVA